MGAAVWSVGCLPVATTCVLDADCAAHSACVAGRCLPEGSVAAISSSRRLLYDPVDVAYVEPRDGATPLRFATLGRGDGAIALLRFSIAVPSDANVIEAYLLLDRSAAAEPAPEPVTLRVGRIVEPWDSRSVSWARQPGVADVGAPLTRVRPGAVHVRLDVRKLVEAWRKKQPNEFGLAVSAEGRTATGVVLALEAGPTEAPPRLELYVK
jgi:hypothetical protein